MGTPLAELFKIERFSCPKVEGIQSYRVGYHFYPKVQHQNLKQKLEIRVIVSSSVQISF
jgi:hypothetical protein